MDDPIHTFLHFSVWYFYIANQFLILHCPVLSAICIANIFSLPNSNLWPEHCENTFLITLSMLHCPSLTIAVSASLCPLSY